MIIANVACNVHGCVVACEQKKVKDGAPGRSVCFGGKRGGTLNEGNNTRKASRILRKSICVVTLRLIQFICSPEKLIETCGH